MGQHVYEINWDNLGTSATRVQDQLKMPTADAFKQQVLDTLRFFPERTQLIMDRFPEWFEGVPSAQESVEQPAAPTFAAGAGVAPSAKDGGVPPQAPQLAPAVPFGGAGPQTAVAPSAMPSPAMGEAGAGVAVGTPPQEAPSQVAGRMGVPAAGEPSPSIETLTYGNLSVNSPSTKEAEKSAGVVTALQKELIDLGYDIGRSGIDGDYGWATEAAIKAFQDDFGLPSTGVYDSLTASVMRKAPTILGQRQDPRGEANEFTRGYNDGKKGFSLSTFVDYIGNKEGTKEHMGPEKQLTLGYGILPSTASNYGVDYGDYNNGKTPEDRRAFAEAVYEKMYSSAVEKHPSIFNSTKLSTEDKIAALSLYINLGTLYKSTENAILSGDTKKVGEDLAGIIHYRDKVTGVQYNSLGLSKRRAQEYNEMLGYDLVAEVLRDGSTYTWVDSEGNTLFTKTGSGTPDNKATRIAVPKITGATQTKTPTSVEPVSDQRTYKIRPGDKLSNVASSNDLSLSELLSFNPQITNPNSIRIGQEINLGPPVEEGTGEGGGPGGASYPTINVPKAYNPSTLGMIGGVRDADRVWQGFNSRGMAHDAGYKDYSQLFREYTTKKKPGYIQVGVTAAGKPVYAAPDYLKDEKGNYVSVNKDDAVRLANSMGGIIPTRKMVEHLYGQATRIRMHTIPNGGTGSYEDSVAYTKAISDAMTKGKFPKNTLFVHGKEFAVPNQ